MIIHDVFMWIGGLVITGVYGLIGWQVKMLHSKIEENEKSINEHKLYAANTFATRIDVDKGFERIMDKLDKIDEKLDRKMDK